MSLNSLYVIAPSLQEYFVDKTTGFPLAGGKVYFYKDQARTIPKPVFELSGNPPDYSYTELPNPVTLSSVGTFQDPDGNDIIPYYYPYDENGKVEDYYIVVKDANGVEQFTREAWPNFGAGGEENQDLTNYVPNGQFLIHTNIPGNPSAIPPVPAGKITQPTTILAQGGWTFDRPSGTTSVDFVTFDRFGSDVENPTSSPRYAVRVQCQSPNAGDSYKDLRLKFFDVNKFSSSTQQYTYAFTAESNTASSVSVDLVLVKNYGTGGSATTETDIATLTILPSYQIVQTSFVFGTNNGKSIGTQNDDYLQLAIRFPTDSVFDISITDVLLTPNAVAVENFPETTTRQFSYQSLTAPVPDYNAYNLYLPLVLTPDGLGYDDSEVGMVKECTYPSLPISYLYPDGSKYSTTAYSTDGIPYARLQGKYWIDTLQTPRYGTGTDYFVSVYKGTILEGTNQLILSNNQEGPVTACSDGTIATGFTFTRTHVGSNTYFCRAVMNESADGFGGSSTNTFWIINDENGTVTNASAGTSGFTINVIQEGAGPTGNVSQITSVTTVASAGLAGTYFTFYTVDVVGAVYTIYQWYCWFQVDGSGADPAPGGTGILVKLFSTDPVQIVALKIQLALNSFEVTSINTVAASSIPPGAYFNATATGQAYYVWYTIDGVGTDPAPANKVGIKVALLSSDTNQDVCSKTQKEINSKFFAMPDFRGYFPRYWDMGASVDPNDACTRFSFVPGVIGDVLGTYQLDQNLSHTHVITNGGNVLVNNAVATATSGGGVNYQVTTISNQYSGGLESRPINIYVNPIIKY